MGLSKDPEKRKRQLENLKSGKKFVSADEQQRKIAKKGGLRRAELHKSADRLKRWKGMTAMDGDKPRESVFYPGEEMQNGEFLDLKLMSMAREGNLEAMKYIDKKTGDAPDERLNVNVNGSVTTSGELRIGFSDEMFEDE